MSITGIHHITIICADARRTIDFYTRILGMSLVKKTVNFDDPSSYHLYFGNSQASPGSLVTYFEWKGAERGHWGIGGTHHYALQALDYDALLKWKRWLTDHGLAVDGPLDRHYFKSIYFTDPDGTILEIATLGPGWTIDEAPDALGMAFREPPAEMIVNNRDEERIRGITWPEPVGHIDDHMALTGGLHHITAIGANINRTDDFLGGLLGMQRVKMTSNFDDPTQAHWYWGADNGRPGTLITYFERDPARVPKMRMGPGQTHHYALALPDDDTQLAFRDRLVSAGLQVTGVKDRIYFKSIYLNDPDGHIIELATAGPGMAIDEDPATLGASLRLPHWLEQDRDRIERRLVPLA